MRRAFKDIAERLLVESGLPRLARQRHTGDCLVLAFHNIVQTGKRPAGDRPLHLPLDAFERFLDALTPTHEIVGLESLASSQYPDSKPRAAITFDDAYAGAILHGLPALAARNLPVTVFVAPGLLGRHACWWDRLAHPDTGLGESLRRHALGTLGGDDDAVMAWALGEGRAVAPGDDDFRIATEGEVAAAAREPGVTLGAHTWSHPNLTALSADQLRQELDQPLAWLRQRFATTRPWLAYPYGMTSPTVAHAAELAGYTFGFEIAGGWFAPGNNAWRVPRLNISAGVTERGFILRAAGLYA